MKFDVCIMNPPYDGNLCEKFEVKILELCNSSEIVWVAPSTWLLGKHQNKLITNYINKYKSEIITINPYNYFDVNINKEMSVVYINTHIQQSYLIYDNKRYDKCNEITKYSNDEILMSILDKIGCKHLEEHVGSHVYSFRGTEPFIPSTVIDNPNDDIYICRLIRFGGSSTLESKKQGDFYALLSNNKVYEDNCGLYSKFRNKLGRNGKRYIQNFVKFDTELECKNFWNYIHTDFVNLCLYFIKTNLHLDRGELKYIPWQDFNEEWDDKKLFKKYCLTNKEIEHIYKILPNYYNLNRNLVNNC